MLGRVRNKHEIVERLLSCIFQVFEMQKYSELANLRSEFEADR